ncbi:MAG: oxygenase MpaB family protein [Myxococcota bacterium]
MKHRFARLAEIETLDPVVDHERIVRLDACYEFPWDLTRSLELALFRTYAVPSISKLLARTGEFTERTQKRYDDTELLIRNFVDWGYDSDRGRRAIERMNAIHGRFRISNDDFLYVLSTFVCEPIRWNQRFGWRPMVEQERLAFYYFWFEVGKRMGIRDIPATYAAFFDFNERYEREHFRFHEDNRVVGSATRDLFVGWFPKALAPLTRRAVYSIMDEPVLDAFGFPHPTRLERALVERTLRARAVFLNRAWRPRTEPQVQSDAPHASYPTLPPIEALGPPDPPGRHGAALGAGRSANASRTADA